MTAETSSNTDQFVEPVAYEASARFDLTGRTVLITGAAHGLGLAVATAFVGAGAAVALLDFDEASLLARTAEMQLRGRASARVVDVRDDEAVQRAVDSVAAEFGGIDVVINDAAIFPTAPMTETKAGMLMAALDVNVAGQMRTVTAALPHLLASSYGRIINFSSVTYFLGEPAGLGAYIASKGAVIGLTRSLARELGTHGITANVIAPGAFPTRAEHGVHADQAAFDREVVEKQSIKRRGDVQDIATAVLFLASDAASFITGQTLLVDGGWAFN